MKRYDLYAGSQFSVQIHRSTRGWSICIAPRIPYKMLCVLVIIRPRLVWGHSTSSSSSSPSSSSRLVHHYNHVHIIIIHTAKGGLVPWTTLCLMFAHSVNGKQSKQSLSVHAYNHSTILCLMFARDESKDKQSLSLVEASS